MKKEYTNRFADAGFSQNKIDQRIQQTWFSLFEGPNKIYFETENNTGYLLDTGNMDVRSEGMSYGMMMAVQMNRQDIFDRIWLWTVQNMYMKKGIHQGYFAWSCSPAGKKNSYGPAPDGEEYFAMALFFASHRWGDKESPFNYQTRAKEILRSCVHNDEIEFTPVEAVSHHIAERKTGYSMWDKSNHLIKFIPETDFTDPSYHLPHFYELFSEWAYPEDRVFWQQAAKASRQFLPQACHPETGLSPEYSYYDGQPHPHFNKTHMDFYSDSYRVAANIGLDAEWFGVKKWHSRIAANIQTFFEGKNPQEYTGYTLDGKAVKKDYVHHTGLIATNAMASLATSGELALKTVRQFWATPLRTDRRRYYDNCLYFFAMLSLSGRYRIY